MRYIVLVLLNLPVIFVALISLVTQYKIKRINPRRFRIQIISWVVILIGLIVSFPAYNYLNDKPIFASSNFSLFDITETTAIIYLIFIINNHRRKIEFNEKMLRDLHQELSIKITAIENPK